MRKLIVFVLAAILAVFLIAQVGSASEPVEMETKVYFPVIQQGRCFVCWLDDWESCDCPWCIPSVPGHVTTYCVGW